MINRSAAYQLGFTFPTRAIGQSVQGELSSTRFEVIGVMSDLPTDSVRETIRPTAYYVGPALLPLISIRYPLGRRRKAAEVLMDQNIQAAYAFEPSPVTGFFSLPRAIRNENKRDLVIDRIYERGEILALVRSLLSLL